MANFYIPPRVSVVLAVPTVASLANTTIVEWVEIIFRPE